MMLVKWMTVLVIGTLLGLAATSYVLRHNVSFDEVKAGPWRRWPRAGAMDIDPYAHAKLARSGQMPLASAEGLSFFAWTDSSGRTLQTSCDYVVKGSVPPSRYWTLSLYSPTGELIENPAKRFGFTSAELLRSSDGAFTINVSQMARPGNWLPAAKGPGFALVLRLYDTLFDFGMAKVDAATLPQIALVGCEKAGAGSSAGHKS